MPTPFSVLIYLPAECLFAKNMAWRISSEILIRQQAPSLQGLVFGRLLLFNPPRPSQVY